MIIMKKANLRVEEIKSKLKKNFKLMIRVEEYSGNSTKEWIGQGLFNNYDYDEDLCVYRWNALWEEWTKEAVIPRNIVTDYDAIEQYLMQKGHSEFKKGDLVPTLKECNNYHKINSILKFFGL